MRNPPAVLDADARASGDASVLDYAAGRGMTPLEAATYVGLSVSTLAKLRVSGDSPPYCQVVANGAVRYRLADLDAWMRSRTIRNTSDR